MHFVSVPRLLFPFVEIFIVVNIRIGRNIIRTGFSHSHYVVIIRTEIVSCAAYGFNKPSYLVNVNEICIEHIGTQ